MYANIPTANLRHVIEDTLNYNLTEAKQKQEFLKIYDLIINQNYFFHNVPFSIKKKG
jgi:hypothetical protein